MRPATLFFLMALVFAAKLAPASTIIHAGKLIDGKSDAAQSEMSIVIEEGKITSVAKGYIAPKDGDKVIDLKAYTVLPGLMDMHTHLMSQHSKDSYTERFFMEQAACSMKKRSV